MFSNHRTLQLVGTVYKIHSSKVSIIRDASCVRFDFLYIVAIFCDVNSLGGSLKYAEPGGRSPSQRGGASVHPVAGSVCLPPESWGRYFTRIFEIGF